MRTAFFLALYLLATILYSQAGFEPGKYLSDSGELLYRVLVPKNFDSGKKYPLVLFLHGAGERGNDNQKQLKHGSELFLNAQEKYPAVVVFPQCPQEDYWSNLTIDRSKVPFRFTFDYSKPPSQSMKMVISLLDSLISHPQIDSDRVYVGGLSMGGMGTYEILYRKPDTFAAAFAICGAGDPDSVDRYAESTPLWIFHGAKDNLVLPSYSTEMVIALKKAGANPKYNLYKDANHNSWDPAFAEPDFLNWIFNNKK